MSHRIGVRYHRKEHGPKGGYDFHRTGNKGIAQAGRMVQYLLHTEILEAAAGGSEALVEMIGYGGSCEIAAPFLYKENPALDAGFRERYAFDQKSSKS